MARDPLTERPSSQFSRLLYIVESHACNTQLFFDNENPVYISSRVCCFSSPWVLLDVICLHPAITFVLLTGTGYTNNTVILFLIKVIAGTPQLEGSERAHNCLLLIRRSPGVTIHQDSSPISWCMPDFAAYAV